MLLSPIELDSLYKNGFLILPDRFSTNEVDLLVKQLPSLFNENHPANIIEKSSGEIRTCMGLHLRNEIYAKLIRHPRLIAPATQVHNQPLYVQQCKVNSKAAFNGERWQWHYDFATHHNEDGVQRPEALNLHIFFDDVSEFNGPLYFIPGSHKFIPADAYLDTVTTSYPLWVVDEPTVSNLVKQYGLVSAKGGRGTMLIFFDTLIHASSTNISPWQRSIFSLIVNPVSNAPTQPGRPDHKHHTDLTPITLLPDSCLQQ